MEQGIGKMLKLGEIERRNGRMTKKASRHLFGSSTTDGEMIHHHPHPENGIQVVGYQNGARIFASNEERIIACSTIGEARLGIG